MTDIVDITFRINLETGEASLSDRMAAKLEGLPVVLRADLTKDIMVIAENLYADAMEVWRASYAAAQAGKPN